MTDLFEYFRTGLIPKAAALSEGYRNAEPFPHAVIDDFLPADVAERALELFPDRSFAHFKQPDHEPHQIGKLGRLQDSRFAGVDPWLRRTLFDFNSLVFLDFLEALTGIAGLIPDPHFLGGAFHLLLPEGKLDIHADFNTDERRMVRRRVNVLLYLNTDWQPGFEGELEFWSADMRTRVVSIAPRYNRCVIFNTSSTSFHGHPIPLAGAPGFTRKSLALYYYTSDPSVFRPEARHHTRWRQPVKS